MAMATTGQYLGMALSIADLDSDNAAYFRFCAQRELRLQRCKACQLMRYPPGSGCPWCAGNSFEWTLVSGRGSVYSYTEVRHPVQPAFRTHVPYLALLVELDEQRGLPTEHEAIRMIGNLATPEAALAPPEVVRTAGIGSRVRVVFALVGPNIAIPLWTMDGTQPAGAMPWRYPEQPS
jgi:uncharacterized OB-fold protein